MEINIQDDAKRVEVWLTKAESNDSVLRERLKPLYKSYKQKKYLVAVFHSGTDDLFDNTRYLLQNNLRELVKSGPFQESEKRC